ncbi:hypothetical protein EDF46_3452 [Frondihabitans sp. PhB188]|uniref:hypothetical protein n=1 Tax=Frondihabitans sp. PhB188 TaxID=2485200 RepID=UPI000FA1CCC5|nr:hypothetical protein [Frondihabitans sp. PhB188]ROQ30940.1 hypothetical protein EDF46_3452 [Frondihabitans sp. PhB188]
MESELSGRRFRARKYLRPDVTTLPDVTRHFSCAFAATLTTSLDALRGEANARTKHAKCTAQ